MPATEADIAEAPRRSKRRADVDDVCAATPGKPAPKPVAREYTGVAVHARCQREVLAIMGGVTHFLGVKCAHCHHEPDYPKMTENKQVANWMASELIPRLRKKGGGEVWCNDCHLIEGKGTAKILGEPRDRARAVEWMTTVLVEKFETADGKPLRCKDCHQENLGHPGFQRKIILTERLPKVTPRSVPMGSAGE